MRRPVLRYRPAVLIGAFTLAGCATMPAARPPETVASRFERIRDSLVAEGALEEPTTAEDAGSAPRVRLYIPPTGYTAVNYVDAAFRVSADAYVLVMTVDRDHRVRVLYPESPTESGLATKEGPTRLTRFFGGFGTRTTAYASYDLSQRLSPFGAGGVLVAVASDRPLQLQRLLDQSGDWDMQRLEELVFERTLPAATDAVAQAVLLAGQEYSTDYLTYSGSRTLNAFQSYASGVQGCGLEVGGGWTGFDGLGLRGYPSGDPFTQFVGVYQRDGRTYARYVSGGGCGAPVYYDVPTPHAIPAPVPVDTTHRDTAATTSRWAVERGRQLDGRGTVAVSGLRFRTPGDRTEATPRTFPSGSRFTPRGADMMARSPRTDAQWTAARFGVNAAGPSARQGPTVARGEPRVERRVEAPSPARTEPRAVAHHRDPAQTVTAH